MRVASAASPCFSCPSWASASDRWCFLLVAPRAATRARASIEIQVGCSSRFTSVRGLQFGGSSWVAWRRQAGLEPPGAGGGWAGASEGAPSPFPLGEAHKAESKSGEEHGRRKTWSRGGRTGSRRPAPAGAISSSQLDRLGLASVPWRMAWPSPGRAAVETSPSLAMRTQVPLAVARRLQRLVARASGACCSSSGEPGGPVSGECSYPG